MRDCAVETHVNISQELATLYGNVQVKCHRPEGAQNADAHFAQSKCTSTFRESHFTRKFTGKMPRPRSGTRTLCEPAQSKRMSTFHKTSHCRRKFSGKKARAQSEHPDQAPAFTLPVRTPQCGHAVWGKRHYARLSERTFSVCYI